MPIFDQGYQHWNGALTGHTWRWLAITRHGVRGGFQNRYVRALLLAAWSPALALAFMLSIWGLLERKSDLVKPIVQSLAFLSRQMILNPRDYRLEVWTLSYDYFLLIELRLSMIIILLIGPNLISQDLRLNALPLYFSRPLRRIDYFLGKLGIITAFLAMVIVAPCILAYILGLLCSLDITIIRDTWRLLVSSVAYGLIISFSAGLLVLALSSLSRNSRYIALFWLGIWIVSSITAGVLEDAFHEQHMRVYYGRMEHVPHGQRFAMMQASDEFQRQMLEAQKTNWRPLVSYIDNLSRIRQQLLGTNKAWQSLAKLHPSYDQPRFLMMFMGPTYPWYWSAYVLLGLAGLSVCVLHFQVKSLDRLK
jgi:ABC-2 type transport system permease protein